MRSLLLIVFSTLVVLLATTGAVSPDVPNLEPATKKSGYASTSPVRSLSAEYNVDEKRRLRGDDNSMGMEEFNTDDEERASFMANIVEQAKAYYYGIKVGLNPHTESKWVMRYEDELYDSFYKLRETPASIRALYLDRKGILADRYKGWYDNKNKLAANKLARN